MQKLVLIQMWISIVVLLLFFSFFTLLQNTWIYNSTLAKISNNYEREGVQQQYEIKFVKKPFLKLTENNLSRWDASAYKSIRDSSYRYDGASVHCKFAFYPLFPFLWKILSVNSITMVFINYLLFIWALMLLYDSLVNEPSFNLPVFAVALVLPSAVIFYLPYAESLFLFTMAIAVWGIFRKKYWLYFAGMYAMSMTRPAILILIVAFLVADIRHLLQHRNYKYFFKDSWAKLMPLVLGFLSVILIQYLYSDSLTAYWDALIFWPTESGFFNTIRDWSIEGFGMTVIAIFFLAIPALVYSLRWGSQAFSRTQVQAPRSILNGDYSYIKEYLFNVSALFIAGNLFYTFLTSGNVWNGFYRYTLCTPCFYIILFLLPERLSKISIKNKIIYFLVCLTLLILFLSNVVYGEDRLRFQYTGMYLFLLFIAYLLFGSYIPFKVKVASLVLIALISIVWQTYLLNMFLSNGWIYT